MNSCKRVKVSYSGYVLRKKNWARFPPLSQGRSTFLSETKRGKLISSTAAPSASSLLFMGVARIFQRGGYTES